MQSMFIGAALGMCLALALQVRTHNKEIEKLTTGLKETREFCLKLQKQLHPDAIFVEPGTYQPGELKLPTK